MGRKKQVRPRRSTPLIIADNAFDTTATAEAAEAAADAELSETSTNNAVAHPYYVEIDQTTWVSHHHHHRDISEIILRDLHPSESYHAGFTIGDPTYSLRFCISNFGQAFLRGIKLGHWLPSPIPSSTDVSLELVHKSLVEGSEMELVLLSGSFDGPPEGITALVHLASLNFLSLRPLSCNEIPISADMASSLRIRVEILDRAFDACDSLLDDTRQSWRKSIIHLMAWLRPEVTTPEAKYRLPNATPAQVATSVGGENYPTPNFQKSSSFDVAAFYEAIKPEKSDPMLEDELPDLIPVLRPYQRRAAYWMVQKEKGDSESMDEKNKTCLLSPLCVPVRFVDACSYMFYNPFSGSVSLRAEFISTNVSGGILADEMGLGKTVELLACILAHPKPASEGTPFVSTLLELTRDQKISLKRLKRERVECICGAVSESYRYEGLWVQCDICDAWQHADCVGYSPKGKKKMSTTELQKHRKQTKVTLVERDGEHICQMCLELIQATDSPMATGATLIVCPVPILPQWHAEIMRHTRMHSLKICIYDGVRDRLVSNSAMVDMTELLSADIVLTTYDVLKEDLSHDSDRHEGDRHFLRFQKRYPVIPTVLTRIFWWRICLDEAQMVESNTAAATEMALRLSAKHRWCITGTPIQRKLDDLYGLLRFIKASPFDVYRWWTDVIRDPYERRDVGALYFTHRFFKQIMWRSSKVHVADELQLPPQEECVSWLTFSAIEEHFYQRQHETCLSYAREVIGSLRDDILKRKGQGDASSDASSDHFITHTEAAKLLNSLLKLRQACCHPQVGSSGLRSLQQTPMTMEEILMVLVNKTKIEGEEALRKLVIALNALAGIAILQRNFWQAVLLYKEALATAEEHSEDFRLDPLVSIHIHHNLTEILPMVGKHQIEPCSCGEQFHGDSEKAHKAHNIDLHPVKRRKIEHENSSLAVGTKQHVVDNHINGNPKGKDGWDLSFRSLDEDLLRATCENLKQKYLSLFRSKLSTSQQDFGKLHTQVCNGFGAGSKQQTIWWLDALQYAEQNREFSSELLRKIDEAISGTLSNSSSSRVTSRFRSITSLKYHMQTRLDELEASREKLLDRLLEVNQTLDRPREEDIERVRSCRICQAIDLGPLCVHCELEELFQDYEARLFRLNKLGGDIITSAEEAVDLQKKNLELNRFYWKLSRPNKSSSSASDLNDESKRRDVRDRVVVSKSPSELEVILGVIKSYCKSQLGKEGMSAASKQLHLLEGMRREYALARSLAVAQAQLLRAHDEIKMATSRLHIKEDDNDSSVDALGLNELESASVLHSNDKFMALTLLSSIKGKLRYLKGLVLSKQKSHLGSCDNSCLTQEMTCTSMSLVKVRGQLKGEEEACPICQEKLKNQKMVFQCGHLMCCKCFVAMSEHGLHKNKFQRKWVMCPTCREHTDFGNVAFADDGQEKGCKLASPDTFQGRGLNEEAVMVQGSYGTKIEAVTKRILWIKSSDPEAKVLVFSSWNDVLDVLEHAFNTNGITYIRMKGGRKSHVAISEFKGHKRSSKLNTKMHSQPPPRQQQEQPVQVLLLLIQHGANGLNLLEAQHVVLVEPLLNPAAEAQAINRVHRIGQENRTTVHRFLVKGTVEESIFKLNRSRNTSSFISGKTKNRDQSFLTLKDLESLFSTAPSAVPESNGEATGSLRHLPPSMAAAIAAERRLTKDTA